MHTEQDLFEQTDPDAETHADARAEGDIVAGRLVDHAEVAAWLATWGTPDEKPAPLEWFA